MPKKTKNNAKNKEKKKKLTLKQRKWLHEYMDNGGNATHAALSAYYPTFDLSKNPSEYTDEEKKMYKHASQIGYENLRKLDLPIEELLEEAGLTDIYFVQKLQENMNATKLYGKDAIEGMDGQARNAAWENGMKLKGKLVNKVDITSLGKSIEAPVIRAKIKPRKHVSPQQ